MNREEIKKLEAGKDLDMLISKVVFGYAPNDWHFEITVKSYSTNMRHAIEVIERLFEEPYQFAVEMAKIPVINPNWRVTIGPARPMLGATLPLAICRAALAAIFALQEGRAGEGQTR